MWFITQHESSKVWAKDSVRQKSYSKGDKSWQRAISDYRSGDQESAFKELGHSIHLVSDALVPAHTRDDIHAPKPDSYEEYVKNNWDNLSKNISIQPIYKNKLEDIFDEAAKYSNGNFYSDDTIEDKEYSIHKIVKLEPYKFNNSVDLYFAYTQDADNKILKSHLTSGIDWKPGDNTVKDDSVLSDYAHHLLPKAVAYSAGTIKLFLDETQKNQTDKLPFFRSNLGGLVNGLGATAINSAEKIYKGNTSQASSDNGVINQVKQAVGEKANQATDAVVGEIENIGNQLNPKTPVSASTTNSDASSQVPINNSDNNSDEENKIISSSTPISSGSGGGGSGSVSASSTVVVSDSLDPTTSTPTSTPDSSTSTVPTSTESVPTSTPTSSPVTSTVAAVVINEVAWAGTSQFTPEDEYIELYNNSDQDVELFPASDPQKWWKLKISGHEIEVNKINNSTIPAHGYYLLESPDDRTANEIDGDIIYTGTLSDIGENLELFDSENNLVDEVSSSAGWFAGSPASYSTMEKVSSTLSGNTAGNWQTNQGARFAGKVDGGGDTLPLNGSPKQSNFGSIVLRATQVENERTLPKSDYPYILTYYEIPDGKTLNIEEGVTIKAYYPDSKIEVKGILNILGSDTQKVVMTSDNHTAKSWQGLEFYPGSNGNIAGLDMSYAGASFRLPNANMWDGPVSEAIYADSANLSIGGSNFSDNGDIDIYNINSSSSISNTNFQNGITAIEHHAGALILDNISVNNFSNSTGAIYIKDIWPQLNIINFSNSTNGAVNIALASITSSVSLGTDLPINLENLTIETGGSLTVDKGVVFNLPQYSNIFIKGTLNLNGTPDAPIKFVGPGGVNQYWGHLVFDGGIGNLNSVDFSGGGYNYPGDTYHGVISANNNSELILENCQLIDNRLPVEIIQVNSSTVNLNNTSLGYSTKDTFFPSVKGIQVNTGSLSLNNSFFYNLTTGITAYSIDPLPQFSVTNMDTRNFINVDTYWDPANWFPAFVTSP